MKQPMRLMVPLALALALGACAHAAPKVQIVEVRVPVPVPCLDAEKRPQRPERTPRAALASLPVPEAVRRLLVERSLSEAYEVEAEAALTACETVG